LNLAEEELRPYFPLPQVLEGLFALFGTLFDLKVQEVAAPSVWHPSVHYYELRRTDGTLVGSCYVDLFARPNKRGGAWMDGCLSRAKLNGATQAPVAYLVCNFNSPVGDTPSLLTHSEVVTLFHEFGHGLHHLLTRVEDLGVSGLNGVEWDAVELPSQFMENFCWEWDVLREMTRHVDTGASLPRPLFDKMLAAKNFQSGLGMLRQIEFSVFDMRLHSDFTPGAGKSALDLLQEVRERVAVLMPPAFNRFPNSFSHIFAGGYAAGYYSYKWAEVLSADAYSFFEEQGVLSAGAGKRFRDEILAVGGSRPAAESFRAFRGREPRVDALLKHNGMISA
jgi:oligopeptidase A